MPPGLTIANPCGTLLGLPDASRTTSKPLCVSSMAFLTGSSFSDVNGHVGAEFLCRGEPSHIHTRAGDEHKCRARQSDSLGGKETDGSGTKHRRRLAHPQPSQVDGTQDNGKRLGE